MYSEVYGYRINLVYITILVGLYDLVHILHELKERFYLFQHYENVEQGCFDDLFQAHCLDIYGEVGIYTLDFVFTCFLIYGAKSVRESLNIPTKISQAFLPVEANPCSCVVTSLDIPLGGSCANVHAILWVFVLAFFGSPFLLGRRW